MVEELQLGGFMGRYRGWQSIVEPVAAPSESTEGSGESSAPTIPLGAVVVQFEATGKEDVRLGFAPHGTTQWLYEIALGFSGNTEVVVRKYVPSTRKEIELARVFTGRTLSSEHFVSYWAVVQQGSIVLGIGKQAGVDTVVKCVDTKATENGEAASGVHQIAFTTWHQHATLRNIRWEYITSEPISLDEMTPRVIVRGDPYGEEDLLTPEQRAEYEREYETSLKRVQRFGGVFVPPEIKKFLDPKVIRRLQRTGATDRGFATGIDMLSAEEVQKRESRMKRFDTPQFAVEYSTETVRALSEGMTQEEWAAKEAERTKLRERALKFGLDPDANPKSSSGKGGVMNLTPASNKVRTERCDVKTDTMVEPRDDAIHVYSLDERFQQVRTNDVMEYFTGYGPWYVEWINDSSCTVVFEDAHTAGRALISLSDEIPPQQATGAVSADGTSATEDVDMDAESGENSNSAAPVDVPDEAFNRSQWRYGVLIGSATQPSHKKWRLLLRRATADDFPPEKTGRKYHERRPQHQQRGRGHHQQHQRQNNNRAHPYRRDGGGRRNRRDRQRSFTDSPRDSGDDADTKRPSRLRVNDDGSINVIRGQDESNGDNGVPTPVEQ